jgi:chromosome segregation ATPase
MAQSQEDLVQLADKLQAMVAHIRSVAVPSQNNSTTQNEAHNVNKLRDELRDELHDMNTRLQVVATQIQEQNSSASSIKELKLRLDHHESVADDTRTSIHRIDDRITQLQNQLLLVAKDVTAWRA